MSDKALTRAELELTQRVQLFFPAGVIPPDVIARWNGCPRSILEDVLTKRLAEVFSVPPDRNWSRLPVADFVHDMARKKRWTLLEDTRDPWPISIGNLELVSFFMDDDGRTIGGEKVVARAVGLNANLGQRHAEYMLEYQNEIPESFRNYVLVFPGTKWRDRQHIRAVPCLKWRGERWHLEFHRLDAYFFSSDQLLRSRESS